MTKTRIAIFAATGLLAATGWSAPLNSYVDASVDLHLSFRSLAETRSDWAAHPLAELVADPALQKFFAPLLEDADASEEEGFTAVMENEFGLTWEELFELLPGQITLSFFNMPDLILQRDERPELVIMAEYAGDAEQLAELMQVQFERNALAQKEINPAVEHVMIEESFMGETLHLDETFDGEQTYIEDGYALVDGIFILATPETRLRSAVESIKADPESPLVNTITYQRAREEGGRGDLSVYLNLASFLPPLNEALMEQAMAGGAAMFGLSGKSLDAALSLESMQALFFDVDLVEAGLSAHSGLLYREKAGLLSLMAYKDGPLPQAGYVPADIYSSSVSTIDFGSMLRQLEALLAGASPTLSPMLDMQLQNLRSQTGVDLRSSILENLGNSMVSVAVLPDDQRGVAALVQPEQVIVVGVRDTAALSGAIEALIDLVPGARDLIEVQRFAGQTIHTIRGRPDPNMPDVQAGDLSYVVTRSQFIFSTGTPSLLKEVLTRMETGATGFWQQASTELLFEPIARNRAVSRSYLDLEKVVKPLFQMIVQTSQFAMGDKSFKASDIPAGLRVPFVGVSEMNEATDGFFLRSLLINREAVK